MIERLHCYPKEGSWDSVIKDKLNELIDVVNTYDKQIQACMQRIIELEDKALDTKQEKCPTCNGCDNNITGHTD